MRLHVELLRNSKEEISIRRRLGVIFSGDPFSRRLNGLAWHNQETAEPLWFIRDRCLLPRVNQLHGRRYYPGAGRWTRYLLPITTRFLLKFLPYGGDEIALQIQSSKWRLSGMPKVTFRRQFVSRLQNRFHQAFIRLDGRLNRDKSDPEVGFFDAYPRFHETSVTGSVRNRLNQRHRALIERNEAIIRGKSVLDIASHDGRWSFAAHKAGARYVLGIEAREHLVKHAEDNLRAYAVPEAQVQFVLGDVFRKLDELEPERFETICCFGFFYHTMHHMLLLNKIARLRPAHLILDTSIDLDRTTWWSCNSIRWLSRDPGWCPTRATLNASLSAFHRSPLSI